MIVSRVIDMNRLRHPELTLARAVKFFERMCSRLIRDARPLEMEIAGPMDRLPREEALRQSFRPAKLGEELGPPWSTFWLKIRGNIPSEWRTDRTVAVRFVSGSEALLWLDGRPYQGFNWEEKPIFRDGGRAEAVLPADVVARGRVEAEIEIACNGLWGAPAPGLGAPTSTRYRLYDARLVLRDEEAWALVHDLALLVLWLSELPELKAGEVSPISKKLPPWPGRVLQLLNRFCNVCDSEDPATWTAGREILREILSHRNGSHVHRISAVGHAHIDTAWLWPIAETKRKCARSFSSALRLMARYEDFRFACSQAQQYQWIQENYPALYLEILDAVRRGRWIPVGGTWIEPDCNLPSGESLVRQFLYGQRFFKREFGSYARIFWNPDVFGYSGALPQILKGAGIRYFLTQKLSWNQFNRPLHQNFLWEGVDGSRVLVHFPPADTYNALDFDNLLRHFHQHERNAVDHDRVSEAMMLFGFGDGGGGPTDHMVETIGRLEDFQGFPRVQMQDPHAFFERLEKSLEEPPVHVGELYLEYHRGTYTTHADVKRCNRLCERLLRDVEMAFAFAHVRARARYPAGELEGIWKKVLLLQFHDILPGTSIRAVYEEAARDYAECLKRLEALRLAAAEAWVGPRKTEGATVVNTLCWPRRGIVEWQGQTALVSAPPLGFAPLVNETAVSGPAVAREEGGVFVLENGLLCAVFDRAGRLVRLTDLRKRREVLADGEWGNRFRLFEDYPHAWDAWDVDPTHLEKADDWPADAAEITQSGPLRAGIRFRYGLGTNVLSCEVVLDADSPMLEFRARASWQMRHRFLKVEFPVAVRSPHAAYEIQFGHVWRPTHFNTGHDIARFESPAHFWCDLSETGYGVALLNDCKYGHSVHGHVMRLSLIRGPTHPDPEADKGEHVFRYAIYPHAGTLWESEVVRRAHEFNTPWLVLNGVPAEAHSEWSCDSRHLILDTVKKAEDSDDLIFRLYECHGARGWASFHTALGFSRIERVNLLEEEAEPIASGAKARNFALSFRPFELISLRCSP